MRDEMVMLGHRIDRPHRVDEQPIEVTTRYPVQHDLVEVRESGSAEVVVLRRLEVAVSELTVGRQLVRIRQAQIVGDREVLVRDQVKPWLAARDQGKEAPSDQR